MSDTASRDVHMRESTALLWERIVASTDEEEIRGLREEIVVLNLRVARSIARRYSSRGIQLDDLVQVASVGLVKAVRGFDPTLRKDFLSYAVPTISGEVKRHFRDAGWAVRPPRRLQDLQARINAAMEDPAHPEGRVARPAEIAEALGIDLADVTEALACNGAFTPTSLDTPVGETESSDTLGALLVHGRDDYVHAENTMLLQGALSELSPRDLLILRRRFWDDRTQQQIGEEIGVTQMQVSRLLIRILAALRGMVAEPGLGQTA